MLVPRSDSLFPHSWFSLLLPGLLLLPCLAVGQEDDDGEEPEPLALNFLVARSVDSTAGFRTELGVPGPDFQAGDDGGDIVLLVQLDNIPEGAERIVAVFDPDGPVVEEPDGFTVELTENIATFETFAFNFRYSEPPGLERDFRYNPSVSVTIDDGEPVSGTVTVLHVTPLEGLVVEWDESTFEELEDGRRHPPLNLNTGFFELYGTITNQSDSAYPLPVQLLFWGDDRDFPPQLLATGAVPILVHNFLIRGRVSEVVPQEALDDPQSQPRLLGSIALLDEHFGGGPDDPQTFDPGESLPLMIELRNPSREPFLPQELIAEDGGELPIRLEVRTTLADPPGTFELDDDDDGVITAEEQPLEFKLLEGGSLPPRFFVQFAVSSSLDYQIQYSDDQGATWRPALHSIVTQGSVDQRLWWLDGGPPKTASPIQAVDGGPGTPGRIYRLVSRAPDDGTGG